MGKTPMTQQRKMYGPLPLNKVADAFGAYNRSFSQTSPFILNRLVFYWQKQKISEQ